MSQTQRGREGWGEFVKSKATERSMGNGRLVFSALSLLLGATFVFSSLFYVPAYFDSSSFGDQHHASARENDSGALSRFSTLLSSPRGYVLAGQTLEGQFAFSHAAEAEFELVHCKAPPILEVFQCKAEVVTTAKRAGTTGYVSFIPEQNGFYQMRVRVSGGASVPDYHIVWHRK